MNIYSSYCKLNDYKGASCGQHSALSTQHSALSTQPNCLAIARHIIFFGLCILLPTQLLAATPVCDNGNGFQHPSPDTACAALNGPRNGPPYGIATVSDMYADYVRGYCFGKVTPDAGGGPPYVTWTSIVCYCQTGPTYKDSFPMNFKSFQNGDCKTTSLTLTLTPAPNQKDPRPLKAEGKDGKSTYELIAKVMEGSTPKAGVAVGFGVGVEAQTGGHAHGDLGSIPRPKGKLSKTSGETDLNGEIKLTFIADEPAGLHAVVADCAPAGCANKATHVVKVKVPDLIHIPPDFGNAPARYVLIGNYKTPENPAQQINHNDTHFLTERSWANLDDLINTFIRLGWGQIGINDASLEWGGMFDIEGKWLDPVLRPNGKFTTGGHAEHRDGQQVDISFVRPAGVSEGLRKKVYDEACSAKEAELPRILWHKNDGYAPHFHIYLTGKGVTGAKKQCGVS